MEIRCEAGTIDEVLLVDAQIPEFTKQTGRQRLESRLLDKRHLILVAKVNGTPVAYKIGYQLTNDQFYSWLGGVHPNYRKQGIATQLRQQQETWAQAAGYSAISVKSMNRYPAMLQLLISSGYSINGYEDNGDELESKILFIKRLSTQ